MGERCCIESSGARDEAGTSDAIFVVDGRIEPAETCQVKSRRRIQGSKTFQESP